MKNVSTYGGSREARRSHWLYRFECDGQTYTGGVGCFPDGRIAEVFINGAKVGTAAETSAQDAAIVASLALQQGCPVEPVETIRHALARPGGSGGPLVTLLNQIASQIADGGADHDRNTNT
jgi:hypothetical protein